jgi:hypothetical protein
MSSQPESALTRAAFRCDALSACATIVDPFGHLIAGRGQIQVFGPGSRIVGRIGKLPIVVRLFAEIVRVVHLTAPHDW